MSKVDLHVHTTASDGRFSPAEIVGKAAELGLTFIAIADHDTVAGIAPALAAARAFPQLTVIPSVEVSTDVPDGEVHILGYFVDYASQELLTALEGFRRSREKRAQGMIAKLKTLGVDIDWPRVREIAGSGAVGRPHIAKAMLEKGYISSLHDAFVRYIRRDGPAYVEREKMTPQQSVELIRRARGLPVLAHPLTAGDPEAMISGLCKAGLAGVESYYGGYSTGEVKRLVALAAKYGLITTGGSDYHGQDTNAEMMLGGAEVPIEAAEQLMALAGNRHDTVD